MRDNKGMRNLKLAAVVAMIGFAAMSFAQIATTAPPSADKLMSDANARAVKEKKAVWVVFHASW